MPDVRTQNERYWIQVEVEPSADVTGAKMIDLNMVDLVDIVRDHNDDIRECHIVYAGVLKKIGLRHERAQFFYDEWMKFITLQSEAPIAERTKIHLASSVDIHTVK